MPVDTRLEVQRHYSGVGAQTYDAIRLEDPRGWLLSELDIRLFERLFPDSQNGMDVLEVGAGTGRFTVPALERGFNLTATDINQEMLDRLRAKAAEMGAADRCVIQIEDIFNLSFPDESFDYVFGLHLFPRLLTVEDQREAILSAARVVRPGGRMLFNYRNRRSIYGLFDRGPRNSPANIRAVLNEAGMRIETLRGKWLATKRVFKALPMPVNRLIARLDRAMWGFMPSLAWDVFVVAVKDKER